MKARTVQALELSVLGLAVAIRALGLWSYHQTDFADFPMVDAFTYWDQTQKLLAGQDPFAEGFYQPPGYPFVLAILARLTGGADLLVVHLSQALMGVLTTGLLILLGRRVVPQGLAPWAGAAAGLVYTLYPSTLLFEQDLLTPALTCLLSTGALALLWGGERGVPSPLPAALAGLLLGLAVVVHPTYLIAALGLIAWLAWRGLREAPPAWPRSLLALGVALGLALAPTAWLNATKYDQPALVSHNSGLNFYLGNNLDWRETMFLRPGLPFRRLVLQAEPDKRDVAARNDYWWQRAREELGGRWASVASILGTKALWSINDVEVPRNEDYRCRTDDGPMSWIARLPLRYGLVLPFALIGAVALSRRGGPGRMIPLSWAALHLPLVLFLVADRYRLATWPLISLASAAGLSELGRLVQSLRAGRPGSKAWLLLLPLLPLPFLPIDARTAYDPAWCLHVDGNLALMKGEREQAAELYREAMALDPEDWGARDFLARTLAEQGEDAQAIALMEPLLDWFPDHYPSLYFQARQYEKTGQLDLAAETMGRAWRVPGERTSTGVRYVRLLARAGRKAEGRAVVAAAPELQGHPGLEGVLD